MISNMTEDEMEAFARVCIGNMIHEERHRLSICGPGGRFTDPPLYPALTRENVKRFMESLEDEASRAQQKLDSLRLLYKGAGFL